MDHLGVAAVICSVTTTQTGSGSGSRIAGGVLVRRNIVHSLVRSWIERNRPDCLLGTCAIIDIGVPRFHSSSSQGRTPGRGTVCVIAFLDGSLPRWRSLWHVGKRRWSGMREGGSGVGRDMVEERDFEVWVGMERNIKQIGIN